METENKVLVATEIAQKSDENKENAVAADFKMVTFSLAGKDYSIDIMHVKEIAKAGRFTYVPNALPFVLGVYNLRGEIIPILDLRLFFNIEVPERDENKLENMLILAIDEQKFGVVVDKIDKVIGVQKSTIQPPHPLFGDINIKYIEGVVESNNRLYVLLDVTRIFSSKESVESYEKKNAPYAKPQATVNTVSKTQSVNTENKNPSNATDSQVSEKTPADLARELSGAKVDYTNKTNEDFGVVVEDITDSSTTDIDLKFVKESLLNYAKFTVSSVNESWIAHRYSEWTQSKGENAPIQNEKEAEEFLQTFWSAHNGNWWDEEYALNVEKLLPENGAKQIIVWNPGCGKGMETYSLACILKKKYPESKIRVYAQDVDLLNVSNAALMSIPEKLATMWYAPYLTKKANGEYTFINDIRDSIMFEYHDCKNTNALPMVDVIFARDILSLLDENAQETVVTDFLEKMKGNGIAILGDNETMPSSFSFGEKSVGALVAYSKD